MSSTQLQLADYQLIESLGLDFLGERFIAEHFFLKKRFLLTLLPQVLSEEREFMVHFVREVALLSGLDHPNLLPIHHASECDGRYFLVTDIPKGNILAKKREFSEEEVLKIAHQLADFLDYLHSQNHNDESLAHRGLHLHNLYLDGETLLVTNTGLSRLIGQAALFSGTYQQIWNEFLHKMAGEKLQATILSYTAFLAPEWSNDKEADAKADIYSFGVVIYFLLMGHYPQGAFDLPSTRYNRSWDDLVVQCLQIDPDKRPLWLRPLIKSLGPKGKVLLKPQQLQRPEYDPDPAAAFHVDPVIATYVPKKNEGNQRDPLLTQVAIIPGGTYSRGNVQGARDEMPRHAIHLNSFAMDIHSVTNEQFIRFLEVMGGEKDANNNDIIRLRDSRIKRVSGKLSIESGYAKHPVVGVTWYGAVAYAAWVGKRLPTEAEWEIASLGGLEKAEYPTGETIDRSKANFFSSDTTPVMSYSPNGYGLYDMAGNVYDWCQDWYGYNYYEVSVQEPDNPKGPLQGVYRVLRGGCWKSLKEDMRCAHRHRNNPGSMNGTYGFRCATDVV